MGRVYTVSFAGVAVAAAQDLLTVFTGAKSIKVHGVTLGQVTATAVNNVPVSIKRLGAAVTAGSGGTAPTPIPVNPGDAAATITAHANDTSRTTTSGTNQTMTAEALNIINGLYYLPPEEDRIVVGPSSAIVVSLDGAPSASITMSGTITVEELN